MHGLIGGGATTAESSEGAELNPCRHGVPKVMFNFQENHVQVTEL